VDIKIEYVGLRPGEKLYEELITEGENIVPTRIMEHYKWIKSLLNKMQKKERDSFLEDLLASTSLEYLKSIKRE
jgi:FlaA1/EpsC-like NDP-sugar epimerase